MERLTRACSALLGRTAGRIFVGYSGGMDSTVLLHALYRAAADRSEIDRIRAVHVDHGLYRHSADWRDHCERVCGALRVTLVTEVVSLEPGSNLEARARSARYRVFAALLDEEDSLALAHHADDQVESVLLHLFQGRGFYGMPAERPLGRGRLVRPFLDMPRSTLIAYAQGEGLSWVDDPTNEDLTLDRNYLRHRILPELAIRFPGLGERLARLTRSVAADAEALVHAFALDRNPLPLSVLDGLPESVRQSVLRHWLVRHDVAAGVSDSALAEFLDQLESAHDRQPSLVLRGARLARFRRNLYLVREVPDLARRYELPLPGRLALPHGVLEVEVSEKGDATTEVAEPPAALETVDLVPPVYVTFISELEPGVTLRVGGHQRRARTLMREAGLPPWERERLPLIVDARGLAAIPAIAVRDAVGDPDAGCFRLGWQARPVRSQGPDAAQESG